MHRPHCYQRPFRSWARQRRSRTSYGKWYVAFLVVYCSAIKDVLTCIPLVGRQKIARLAYALHLPERYREAAQRYYNLAVINRFTRGRKSEHVAAVCLYIVCRNEQSSQMLIDFSDLLQVSSFRF